MQHADGAESEITEFGWRSPDKAGRSVIANDRKRAQMGANGRKWAQLGATGPEPGNRANRDCTLPRDRAASVAKYAHILAA